MISRALNLLLGADNLLGGMSCDSAAVVRVDRLQVVPNVVAAVGRDLEEKPKVLLEKVAENQSAVLLE